LDEFETVILWELTQFNIHLIHQIGYSSCHEITLAVGGSWPDVKGKDSCVHS